MSDSDPLPARSASRRRNMRRDGPKDRRADGAARSNLPVPIEGSGPPRVVAEKPGFDQVAEFSAQLIGQGGAKRGLRGGPETLDKARNSYLGTEWSGDADRRPPTGRITKTDV